MSCNAVLVRASTVSRILNVATHLVCDPFETVIVTLKTRSYHERPQKVSFVAPIPSCSCNSMSGTAIARRISMLSNRFWKVCFSCFSLVSCIWRSCSSLGLVVACQILTRRPARLSETAAVRAWSPTNRLVPTHGCNRHPLGSCAQYGLLSSIDLPELE